MNNCDIIIPVFNAFDYLQKCVQSVIMHTNLDDNRLIIIDDKSTDERIIPYIDNIVTNKKNKNILFFKNNENYGYIKTVNFGMKYSNNDVLLLNSDTEVINNWLNKIKKCAYSKEKIATVTPLSNNATIASVPKFYQENEIPKHYNLEDYQSFIENISYADYNEIPVGIGFCLYIKRDVIDTVGFFDEESFGKAYGEEEDFCYRCLDHGYRHVLCDDLIIYHKSSQSFGDYYQDIEIDRGKFLMQRYPVHKEITSKWVRAYPLKHVNKNVNYNLCLNNDKTNVLIIIHAWELNVNENKYIGGTSFHVADLIKGLRPQYNFHVFAPYYGAFRLCNYWETGEESTEFSPLATFCNTNRYYNTEYSKMISGIIELFKIDIIHIHHMLGHYFDLIDLTIQYKTKLYITLHDYYPVCPRINKFNHRNEYCDKANQDDCNICLASYSNEWFIMEETKNITPWKEIWNKLLATADKIIVPSGNTKNIFLDDFKHLTIDVIEHGLDISRAQDKLDINKDKKFNVAFLGNINLVKGMAIIEKLIEYSSNFSENIHFHLFGMMKSGFHRQWHKNFTSHGGYDRKDLNILLHQNNINLVCIFSIWPETYCYTVTESVANNIPVLAFDMGAIGQRVKDNNLGWLTKRGTDIPEIYQTIKSIYKDKTEYQNVLSSIKSYNIKTLDDMCNEYDQIYANHKVSRIVENHTERMKVLIKENYLYERMMSIIQNQEKTIRAQHIEIRDKNDLYKSVSWRVGRFVTWFPRKIKKAIKFCFDKNLKVKNEQD